MTLVYKTQEILERLNLKESLYKKYIGILEKSGYVFSRNDKGHRIFSHDDITALESFIELSQYNGITLERAAEKIVSMKGHNDIPVPNKPSHDVMTLIENQEIALRGQINALTNSIDVLHKEMKEQQDHMSKLLQRHDDMLVQSLKESMSNRKLLEEVKSEVAATKEKRSLFSRIFNRK